MAIEPAHQKQITINITCSSLCSEWVGSCSLRQKEPKPIGYHNDKRKPLLEPVSALYLVLCFRTAWDWYKTTAVRKQWVPWVTSWRSANHSQLQEIYGLRISSLKPQLASTCSFICSAWVNSCALRQRRTEWDQLSNSKFVYNSDFKHMSVFFRIYWPSAGIA